MLAVLLLAASVVVLRLVSRRSVVPGRPDLPAAVSVAVREFETNTNGSVQAPVAIRNDSDKLLEFGYHRAKHGYSGGLTEMVDLARVADFDKVLTIEDLAAFASKVPGAVGFTAHPGFESGKRYARAVLWYTRLSPTQSSWALYLFDETEATKHPGEAPKASAIAAAEARVSGQLKIAQELIDAGGPNGVKLSGDYEEKKVIALAVMRLGGSFQHTAKFGGANCGGCRSVVPGGTPSRCGLGVQNQTHWTCGAARFYRIRKQDCQCD